MSAVPRIEETDLSGVVVLSPEVHADDRGHLVETFRAGWRAVLPGAGSAETETQPPLFVQENHSFSERAGTLRGLHFQYPPAAQAKLVRVAAGRTFTVALDLRADSPTRLEWVGVELDDRGHRQLWIPEGCAHGFLTLEPDTRVVYRMTAAYDPEREDGLRWDDPAFGIRWPAEPTVLSERDRGWAPFSERERVVAATGGVK